MKHPERRLKVEKWEQIRAEIRDVLMSKWDPIGVADLPEAADEYDSYIDDVYRMLENHSTHGQIEEYLRRVETERMGLTDDEGKPLVPDGIRARAVTELQSLHAMF